jgi:hypothetical protein
VLPAGNRSTIGAALVNGRPSEGAAIAVVSGYCARSSGPSRLWNVADTLTSHGSGYAACALTSGAHGGVTLQNSSVRGSCVRPLPVCVRLRSSFRLQISTRSRPMLTPPDRKDPAGAARVHVEVEAVVDVLDPPTWLELKIRLFAAIGRLTS